MFTDELPPEAAGDLPPAATLPRERLRLDGDLEAARAEVRALEEQLRRVSATVRRERAWRTHWRTRLGLALGLLPPEPAREEASEGDIPLFPAAPGTIGEPASTLGVLHLRVRRLEAEARERETRHARAAAAWEQERAGLAARVWLQDYHRQVRSRLRWDWPRWWAWRLQKFWRARLRLLRLRLSRRRLRR